MNRWIGRLAFVAFCVLAFPFTSPAPLIYRPGEGWVYEAVGGGKWVRTRAKDQLEVAQTAFDNKDYSTAFKAARRTQKLAISRAGGLAGAALARLAGVPRPRIGWRITRGTWFRNMLCALE